VIIFLLLHIAFLQLSTAVGIACRAVKVTNKNRPDAYTVAEFGGTNWTPNNFKTVLLKCGTSGDILTALYAAFDEDGDKPVEIFSKNITLMYPDKRVKLKMKRTMPDILIDLEDEKRYGQVG
jgi:hypothetical protein